MSEYYVSESLSYSTCLVGHQLVGDSTIEGYIRELLHSCSRSVEGKYKKKKFFFSYPLYPRFSKSIYTMAVENLYYKFTMESLVLLLKRNLLHLHRIWMPPSQRPHTSHPKGNVNFFFYSSTAWSPTSLIFFHSYHQDHLFKAPTSMIKRVRNVGKFSKPQSQSMITISSSSSSGSITASWCLFSYRPW